MSAPDGADGAVLELPGVADTEALGERLAAGLGAGDLVVLSGPLGAGKTALVRGLARGLGVSGPVTSPTFVIAREHRAGPRGVPLVHVDAYRLSGAAELEDLDLDFDHAAVVVEWGAGLLDGVSDSWLEVVIARRRGGVATDGDDAEHASDAEEDLESDEPRTVELVGHGPRWADTPYATAVRLEAGPGSARDAAN